MTDPSSTPSEKSPRPAFDPAEVPPAPQSHFVDTEWAIRQAFGTNVRTGYELLFRRYYGPLCSHAVRFVYSKEVGQDLVAEVFLNFWKNQVHRQVSTSYRAYLFTAVRNRAYSHLQDEFRRESLLGTPTDQPDDALTYEDPQQILQYTDLYNRLEEEIRALSPQCQRVFVLSRFEGKKGREIAADLQISLKTVEAHLLKALTHLRKALLTGGVALLGFFLGG